MQEANTQTVRQSDLFGIDPDELESMVKGANDVDLSDATINYAKAQSQVVMAQLNAFKSEFRLGLFRIMGALFACLTAAVLLLAGWVLAMVGLAGFLSVWFEQPGAAVLVMAGVNGLAGVALYLFGRQLWQRALELRPFGAIFS